MRPIEGRGLCKRCWFAGKATIYNHRRRARKLGVPSDSTFNRKLIGQLAADYFGGTCAVCSAPLDDWESDHVIPISDGGPDTIWNAQPLCGSCNASKGATPQPVWLWRRGYFDNVRAVPRPLKPLFEAHGIVLPAERYCLCCPEDLDTAEDDSPPQAWHERAVLAQQVFKDTTISDGPADTDVPDADGLDDPALGLGTDRQLSFTFHY